jgi:hypothetical protein
VAVETRITFSPDMHPLPRLMIRWLTLLLASCTFTAAVWALGAVRIVSTEPVPGSFALVQDGRAAPIVVDAADFPGVRRATGDLQADLERVTGTKPALGPMPAAAPVVVIVGTLGESPTVDRLVSEGRLDVAAIRGRWEAFLIRRVPAPAPGIGEALVIAGSDKRGTIYGIYELSEQIGVSPWSWWADVPVPHHDTLLVGANPLIDVGPVVKYRGIFLNDEAPALTGWVYEKFGAFDHRFYTRVFELLLRLRANYLWPAMWQPRAFNADDPQNPALADEYGIVMGTSHHEPMMRAHDEWQREGKGPWNYDKNAAVLRDFWRGGIERVKQYENIVTIGMRGDGDEAMSEETNVALLERIVSDQRRILQEVTGRRPADTPQLWALYKEVQGYYERGMRVPDDVTLLWCDDNWGNLRRLPTAAERQRAGGAGIYYHFDYVGGPRNYKWLNTVPITKVWEQMHLAWQYEANRIWIVNVGDLKPMEFPIEFFLRYAWDPARWPYEQLGEYSEAWAAREFGSEHAVEIAALVNGYTKLNGRRKPEMLAPDTWSLSSYREAERVHGEWQALVDRTLALKVKLPAAARAAYFQLVEYPVCASANVQDVFLAAGRNRWYALQGFAAANTAAAQTRDGFARDEQLAAAYHALNGGKWNHLMDQVKFGYTYWQQPELEAAPAIQAVRPRAAGSLALAIEGSDRSWPSYNAGPCVLPTLNSLDRGSRQVQLFNRGRAPLTFRATANQPWVTVLPAGGTVEEVTSVAVGVDWSKAPADGARATILFATGTGERLAVELPVANPAPNGRHGFVEFDRQLAIEAPHFARAIDAGGVTWRTLPDFGRTLGGVTSFPVKGEPLTIAADSPRLEYDLVLSSTGELNFEFQCAPSLDFMPGPGLQFAVSLDDAAPRIVKLDTWTTLQTWEKAVGDGVRRVAVKLPVAAPGAHVLKLWRVTPGVVFERIVIDAGGVRPSYLGPTESPRLP